MPELTGQPAYRQVAADLRVKITNGTYPVGDRLPSTAQLMDEYGVSITVIRAAIGVLRSDGLTVGQPGKGVYVVREPDAPLADDVATLSSKLAELIETVRHLQERVAVLEGARGRGRRLT